MQLRIDKLFAVSIDLGASEFRLQRGKTAVFCVNATNIPLESVDIDDPMWKELCLSMLNGRNRETYDTTGEVKFGHIVDYKGGRWTFNVYISDNEKLMIARRWWPTQN